MRKEKDSLRTIQRVVPWIAGFVVAGSLLAADPAQPYLGRWALTVPGGGPGWLQITREAGYYDGSILWIAGSVVPLDSVFFYKGMLCVTRSRIVERKNAQGKVIRKQRFTQLITARVQGDKMFLTLWNPRNDGKGVIRQDFTGKRIPPLPPKPDLSRVKFGKPIVLFNGRDLTGWRLVEPNAVNGWVAENGILRNKAIQPKGRHIHYGNLRTEQEFTDFNLQLDVRVPPKGNSGIYLRGIYEVQVADWYGKKPDSHGMGAIYSRITPTSNPTKPAGQWNHFDITLVDRHVTVILNGVKIIDNQPLLGITGGALWSDEFRPGPIMLQGDHTSVDYRNIILRPVIAK